MAITPSLALELVTNIQRDLNAAQAKLIQLRAILVDAGLIEAIPTPEDRTCPDCGLVFGGPNQLAEHRYVSHEGPVPYAWMEAERRQEKIDVDQAEG